MSNPFENLCSPQKVDQLVENTLRMTLNPEKLSLQLVQSDTLYFTIDLLEVNLFERLMAMAFESGDENRVVTYLYESYQRTQIEMKANLKSNNVLDVLRKIQELILRNMSTFLKQPELLANQNMSIQFLDIFKEMDVEDTEVRERFLSSAISAAIKDSDESMKSNIREVFHKCFDECLKVVRQANMITLEKWVVPFILAFVMDKNNPEMANIFLDYIEIAEGSDGIKYSDTLLGQLLCLSITPKNNQGPYEFYDNLNNTNLSALNNLSSSLWNYLKMLHDTLQVIIKSLLVIGGDTKERILKWIGNAITSNQKRGQIWTAHSSMVMGNFTTAPDGFMVGLCAILLRLCQPLMKPLLKVLMVDPTYCAVKNEDLNEKLIHMKDYEKETCLIPCEENEQRITANKYNFITELFFLTHKCIDLSYRVCIEKVNRFNREVHRLQSAYQDAAQGGGTSEVTENIMSMMTRQSQILLCTQNLILEPINDEYLVLFYEASAILLCQLAIRNTIDESEAAKGFAPLTIQDITLPLPNDHSSPFLKYVPELIIENIVGYLQFSKHFETQIRQKHEAKDIFLSLCLIFMGSSKRAKNPHLRAMLADGLESLSPKQNQNGFTLNKQLFLQHPHRLQIVESLLDVFVSIEMTGQSVQFEQKFNYRRPMYQLMQYLWTIDEQRVCFKKLSKDAEKQIDDVEVPIFLRFINVLINDSIFLLDESLENLQKIKEMEEARKNNEWDKLPPNERQQHQQNFSQLGQLARFDNILGKDTIEILKMLTSEETKEIFVHPSMVDRITSMLNYFLLQLCGPNQKRFKVQKRESYDFDPANTVREICQIYLNLKDCDKFCLAVTQDGRSYSPELFKYVETTLGKIHGGHLISDIIEFAEKAKRLEMLLKESEEALVDPPDEFLDPILSTLMREPVILPSSRVTVDKSTITRHLLSDQVDPFNRNPLSMDQLIPDVEMKAKIDAWIKEKIDNFKRSDN